MKRPSTIFVIILHLLLAPLALGENAAAKGKVTRSPLLKLQVSHPAAWRVEQVRHEPDAEGEDRINTLRFLGVDDAGTVLSILRMETSLDGVDPTKHARRVTKYHRDSSIKNGGKVLSEADCTVDGVPGAIVEVEVPSGEFQMRLLILAFVYEDREYKLILAGQADFYGDARPAVMALIGSIKFMKADAEKAAK